MREIQSPTACTTGSTSAPEDLAVLSPETASAYHTTFAPRVIAAPRITKWAHYARFERRILGRRRPRTGFRSVAAGKGEG